jgi:hypothetical protein
MPAGAFCKSSTYPASTFARWPMMLYHCEG